MKVGRLKALHKFLSTCTDADKESEDFTEDAKVKTFVSQIKSKHKRDNPS